MKEITIPGWNRISLILRIIAIFIVPFALHSQWTEEEIPAATKKSAKKQKLSEFWAEPKQPVRKPISKARLAKEYALGYRDALQGKYQEFLESWRTSNWRLAKEYTRGYWDALYGKYWLSKPEHYEKNVEFPYEEPAWRKSILKEAMVYKSENKPIPTAYKETILNNTQGLIADSKRILKHYQDLLTYAKKTANQDDINYYREQIKNIKKQIKDERAFINMLQKEKTSGLETQKPTFRTEEYIPTKEEKIPENS